MSNPINPWNLLHDGTIERAERQGESVILWVEIEYLRERLSPPGRQIGAVLHDCTRCSFAPFDGVETQELTAITAAEPSLLEAQEAEGGVMIVCQEGLLHLRYTSLSFVLDAGEPLPLETLIETASRYWAEWSEH